MKTVFKQDQNRKSLDDVDRESYRAGPPPVDSPAEQVILSRETMLHAGAPPLLSLDGDWRMAEAGQDSDRLGSEWVDAIPARVPGSVHAALVEADRIPDPTVSTNQKIVRGESFKTWWFKKVFDKPEGMAASKLVFDGVCNRCTIWLNGKKLGEHEGMFGGPEFDLEDLLRERNTLLVKLEPIPFTPAKGHSNPENNSSWRKTVVFNNVYGWHYSNLPSLGIWRSVRVQGTPTVSIADPFIAAADAGKGLVDLVVRCLGPAGGWSGTLTATVEPETFDGEAYSFEKELASRKQELVKHYRFGVPEPRLWWPADLGEPDLYRLKLSFEPDGSGQARGVGNRGIPEHQETVFGIRTVEMAPLPEGPAPEWYDWTFVINATPRFIKGTNWCTMDPLMNFSRERYERFITLAALQHIQMLRPWGSGMPETDDFYDLCDRKGIMVLQEWPTAWDSHRDQPYHVLEETVRRNTLRLRNHPALVMYGAGNESPNPFGKAIDMMGRLAVELDGTRPFHRGEPWGGSVHNYDCYWGRQHLDHNLNMTAPFFGEFGLACMPPHESVCRYLPEEERALWPPPEDGTFAYHTPKFNTDDDVSRLTQYARYFVPKDCSLEEFAVGSQLSQAVGIRHTLERARTRWPHCTGALYYKMNDNFPAASWSCVDWYGAPKIGHYILQDAFAPLHACILFRTLNFAGTPAKLPVFLLDDADELRDVDWTVTVRGFNAALQPIQEQKHTGHGSVNSPLRLGDFALTFEQTDSTPLLFVAEVKKSGGVIDRTFYWTNYEAVKGCLFTLPKTTLSLAAEPGEATVANTGELPAVGVSVERPGHADTFTASDGCFWLDPAEQKSVEVDSIQGLSVNAWNLQGRRPSWWR